MWAEIQFSLQQGTRGLPGRSTIAQLLAEHRGVRMGRKAPRLTVKQILTWADAHHRETGRWPSVKSGPVTGSLGETWSRIGTALVKGGRGLRVRTSLAELLAKYRGKRNL
jgi:hypothetical protein